MCSKFGKIFIYFLHCHIVLTQNHFDEPKCGYRLIDHTPLTTNAYHSRESDWPWHAAIYHISNNNSEQQYKCGGTLIHSRAILTAAHCVFVNDGHKITNDQILVQLGKYNLNIATPNTQDFQVCEVLPHENYSPSNFRNDIAILKLSTEIIPTDYVHPICLWRAQEVALSNVVGQYGIVVGWGLTESDRQSELEGIMPIVSVVKCLRSNPAFFAQFLSDRAFCAGFRDGTGACNGDGGGGMYLEENGLYRIRGIVSISANRSDKAACNPNEFVIFTDVAQYLDWIDQMLGHQ